MPNFGKRKIAFSMFPLSLRAGIQMLTECLLAIVSSALLSNGRANRNWFKHKDLNKGNLAMYLFTNQRKNGNIQEAVGVYFPVGLKSRQIQ